MKTLRPVPVAGMPVAISGGHAVVLGDISGGVGGYVQNPDGISLLDTMKTCRTTTMSSGSCAGGTR